MSTKPTTEDKSIDKQTLIANADTASLGKAQANSYEFTVLDEVGVVNVKNASYDETGHVYSVQFENGLPISCSCPADTHYSGPCKHRLSCLIREPIMLCLKPVMADGGQQKQKEKPYTTHTEPLDQGGKEYVRCTGCDRELLTELGGWDQLPHSEDCCHD